MCSRIIKRLNKILNYYNSHSYCRGFYEKKSKLIIQSEGQYYNDAVGNCLISHIAPEKQLDIALEYQNHIFAIEHPIKESLPAESSFSSRFAEVGAEGYAAAIAAEAHPTTARTV